MPDRPGGAQAQERAGRGLRSGRRAEKKLIEDAYTLGERLGLAVWTQDEAGPYQTKPYPGTSWQPVGHPVRQPRPGENLAAKQGSGSSGPVRPRLSATPALAGRTACPVRPTSSRCALSPAPRPRQRCSLEMLL